MKGAISVPMMASPIPVTSVKARKTRNVRPVPAIRRPSAHSRSTCGRCVLPGAGRARTPAISAAASRKVAMSTMLSRAMPPKPAITPPSAAPSSRATSRTWPLREFTVTSWSAGATDGTSAASAEVKNGARQLCTAMTAYTIHARPASCTATSGSRVAAISRLVTAMVRRRSHRST
jgi:hypothetical protein